MSERTSDIGKRYGKLIILKEAMKDPLNKRAPVYCYCKCDCGNEKWIRRSNIRNGTTKSCGCLVTIHGQTKNKLYSTWSGQKDRCQNPNSRIWKHYGGRGIKICETWSNNFSEWLDYIQKLPHFGELDRSLDRIDNNKGYEPENLRWATKTEQSNNKRNNVFLTYKSETRTISQWSEITGVPYSTIKLRIKKGLSIEEVFIPAVHKDSTGKPYTTHGQSGNRLYTVWAGQKERCFNTVGDAYKDYGGRGISMYDGWVNDFASWKKYVEALPHYGNPNRSLDRINNNEDYKPGNLRWATKLEQANNRRGVCKITYDSKTYSASEWGRLTGISAVTIRSRIQRGWSVEKALTTSVKKFTSTRI